MYQKIPHRYIDKKAFTLVELMIVIAIIGILAASLFPSMNQYIDRSRLASFHSQVAELRKIAELYKIDKNFYPTTPCESRMPVWNILNCESSNDPFAPYGWIHNKVTPWWWEIAYWIANLWWWTGNDPYFLLNDDSRYIGNDDAHRISWYMLEQVDKKIDDGNLWTWSFMWNSATWSFTGIGEWLILLEVN